MKLSGKRYQEGLTNGSSRIEYLELDSGELDHGCSHGDNRLRDFWGDSARGPAAEGQPAESVALWKSSTGGW